MRQISKRTSVLFMAGIILLSCDRYRNMPGYDFLPDMVYSRAYEAYSENKAFRDSTTQQVPVYGTMPRGMIAFRYSVLPENRLLAGQTLLPSELMTMKDVFDGKKLFETFCINCHGARGDGNGFLISSGKVPVKPAKLTDERLVQASRGELFHVVTVGFGLMGSYGAILSERDRWKVIEYVKVKLQGQQLGARTLAAANPALSESYEDFEARVASQFPRTNGIGPVSRVLLGTINPAMAKEGEELYKAKCSSCHRPLQKYVGPAPVGIFDRRNPEWIMNMILNPVEMVNKDPVARELLKRYLAPMANQNLTQEEAGKVLEFFRTLKK